jgi:hypothetical protein
VKNSCWICLVLFTLVASNPVRALGGLGLEGNPPDNGSEVPFKLYKGYVIIVEGSIGPLGHRRFLIDTGATATVVDRRISKKLGLLPTPGSISHFNQMTRVEWVSIPELRLGPLHNFGLSVPTADLSYLNELAGRVDAIIGLDVLRTSSFTIDYTLKRITFGPVAASGFGVPMQLESSYLIVIAQMQGSPVRLVVDSGANRLVLYEDRIDGRIAGTREAGEMTVSSLGGGIRVKHVWLPTATLGTTMLNGEALTLSSSTGAFLHADGYLGLTTLRASRVAFDFRHNTLFWQQ